MLRILLVFLSLNFIISQRSIALELGEAFQGTCGPKQEFCAYFSPQDLPIEAVRAYLKSAKKSIRIASYNFGIEDYAAILNEKAQAGVKIEYIIDFKLSFDNNVWPKLIDHSNITKFRTPVMRGGNPQMHNKLIIIDNEVVLTGSANYSSFGLVANYENVMAIRKSEVIAKYNDEIDELKSLSSVLCHYFALRGDCEQGPSEWHPDMFELLTKGSFPESSLKPIGKCMELAKGRGLLNTLNLPSLEAVHECFKNKDFSNKIESFIEKVKSIERYVSGDLTSEKPDYWKIDDKQKIENYRIYFSPEDNIEDQIIQTLDLTLKNPSESFAYVSTNFITNGRIASKLKELSEQGVRLRVFFDRGRFVDEFFRFQIEPLSTLGFFGERETILKRLSELGLEQKYDPSDYKNAVTIFNNELTSDYGCNHNKMAVVGTPDGSVLINGSANWSGSAMRKNGENLMIIKDEAAIAIYLREILSQLLVYRYGQNVESPEFWNEVNYLNAYAPCLKTVLGLNNVCQVEGQNWTPRVISSAILSLEGLPAWVDSQKHSVWVWSPQLNNNRGGAIQLQTHEYFAGRWVGVLPMPLNWNVEFKFAIFPKAHDPNFHGTDGGLWEWEGTGNGRTLTVAPIGVQVIRQRYQWAKR